MPDTADAPRRVREHVETMVVPHSRAIARRVAQRVGLAPTKATTARRLYLDLLKAMLTRTGFNDDPTPPPAEYFADGCPIPWPVHAETMIGVPGLNQLQHAVETVLMERVPGDLMETGVWRGGASIFMRGVLAAHRETTRTVWLADSFEGLPPPDPDTYPADEGADLSPYRVLAVSLEQVQENFRRYGLLDEQVRFLKGYFRDTLPSAPVERLAVLRLDGDLYESTIIALESLYPKLSPGGFVIIDDYKVVVPCRAAVDDFRARHGITELIEEMNWHGVHWRRRS
jgi:O-methyltransferase